MKTYHASPGREARTTLKSRHEGLSDNFQLRQLFQALPYLTAILNQDRQILYSNDRLMELLGIPEMEELLGMRPGEALKCIHSDRMEAGCGTSGNCQVCGAVNTIMRCQETGQKAVDECRLRVNSDGGEDCLDMEVTASPFLFNGQKYIIFTARDISSEKRKEALERIFFHDVINTAGTLQGLVDILKQLDDPRKISQFIDLLGAVSKELTEEILSQKSLLAAENGALAVNKHAFYLQETLAAIIREYREHGLALNKKIRFEEAHSEITLYSDPVLLKRIVTNMIKNALESTPADDEVTVGCIIGTKEAVVVVRNPSFMPELVQKQVFQRSFSTKGKGRGLGTYSMKLLGEKYLGGKVRFTSSRKEGTTFYLHLPVSTTGPANS